MQVLNAADYGVPQARPRLFILGSLSGEPLPTLPDPTHYGDWERRIPPKDPANAAYRLLADIGADAPTREFLGVNTYDGVEWFNGEAFEHLTAMLLLSSVGQAQSKAAARRAAAAVELVADAGEASGYRVSGLLGSRS